MCIIFTLLLFNQNNTVYLHVVTNSFSPESLFTSQYGCKNFRILNSSSY
ncbi:immunoglobulin [Salmonella enterica subsp. enterica serovar Chester]|nr:immunoglobulin [Salmonella enterica subsp. enterica serovar Chester]